MSAEFLTAICMAFIGASLCQSRSSSLDCLEVQVEGTIAERKNASTYLKSLSFYDKFPETAHTGLTYFLQKYLLKNPGEHTQMRRIVIQNCKITFNKTVYWMAGVWLKKLEVFYAYNWTEWKKEEGCPAYLRDALNELYPLPTECGSGSDDPVENLGDKQNMIGGTSDEAAENSLDGTSQEFADTSDESLENSVEVSNGGNSAERSGHEPSEEDIDDNELIEEFDYDT